MADPAEESTPPRTVRWRQLKQPPELQLKSHPFANAPRNSFPDIEDAFASQVETVKSASSNSTLRRKRFDPNGHMASPTSSSFVISPDRDRSTCSHTPSLHNCSLDISIGARAALTEHNRHVNKFGLDGAPTKQRLHHTHHSEDEWDRLMDGNSQASWSTYKGEEGSFTTFTGTSFVAPILDTSSTVVEGEFHNLKADTSDYFNSSRVHDLMTPERNKPKVDEAARLARLGAGGIAVRGANFEHSYVDSVSGSITTECNDSGMAIMFAAAMGLNDSSDKQSSIAATDISKITFGDSSESKKWSDESSSNKKNTNSSALSQSSKKQCSLSDIADLIPPIDITPSRHFKCPREPFSTPSKSPPSFTQREEAEKENCNFGLLGLSPIASQVGSAVGGNEAKIHFQTADNEHLTRVFESPPRVRGPPVHHGIQDFPFNHDRSPIASPIAELNESHIPSALQDITDSVISENNSLHLPGSFYVDESDLSRVAPEGSIVDTSFNDVQKATRSPVKLYKEPIRQHAGNNQMYLSPKKQGRFSNRIIDAFSAPSSEAGTTASTTIGLSPGHNASELRSASKSLLESFELDYQKSIMKR